MEMPEEEEDSGPNVPEELTCPDWMMTMGDCMSLLLTFFVLLLTFSSKEKDQLMNVLGVMKGAFSVWDDGSKVTVEEVEKTKPTPEVDENGKPIKQTNKDRPRLNAKDSSGTRLVGKDLARKSEAITDRLHEQGFRHMIDISLLGKGLSIEVSRDRLFDSQEQVTPLARSILFEAAAVAAPLSKNELRLVYILSVGDLPSQRFGDKWAKANKRLKKLVEVLTSKTNKLPQKRISHAIQVSKKPEDDGKIRIIIKGNANLQQVTLDQIMKAGEKDE